MALAEHGDDLARAKRRAQKIALRFAAAVGDRKIELRLILDPLGQNWDIQALPKGGDCMHHRLATINIGQILDQRLVDLDLVETEPTEVGKRRISGSKVVQNNSDAKGLKSMKRLLGFIVILKEQRFGNLEL